MEKAQLFKRLLAITVDDLSKFIKGDEEIGSALYKLDLAARSRHILHHIQLEDLWQQVEDDSDLCEVYLKMKLAPMTLASCWQLNDDMNNLTWHLVLHECSDDQNTPTPENFAQYHAMSKRLEILDIEDVDIEKACAFLDKAYDFPNQQNPPPAQKYC